MKPRQLIIFLIVLALVDDLIGLAFPVNFQFKGYSFVPHFCFVALMLSIYDRNWIDRILVSGMCGIITDMFFTNTLPVYFILYALAGYAMGIFSKTMEEDARTCFFITLLLVFLLDFIPISVEKILGNMQVSLSVWFIHHEFLTLALHIVGILVLMYTLDVLQRFHTIREHRRQLDQKRQFKKLKVQKHKRQVI